MRGLGGTWAPWGLRIVAGDLELAPMREADLPELINLVVSGIHDPDRMPFNVAWTDTDPSQAPSAYVRYYGERLASSTPGTVALDLVVRHHGQVVGVQGLDGNEFPALRTVESGSWLGHHYQGQGIGTSMRQAACAFAFDELRAERITSTAFLDNPASLAVSRKVGYRPNGRRWLAPRGTAAEQQSLLLTAREFVRGDPITVTGADAYRAFLGIS